MRPHIAVLERIHRDNIEQLRKFAEFEVLLGLSRLEVLSVARKFKSSSSRAQRK